jgi:hypothetical protein
MRSRQFSTNRSSSISGNSPKHVDNRKNTIGGLKRRELKKDILLLLPFLEALPTARPVVDLLLFEMAKRYIDIQS